MGALKDAWRKRSFWLFLLPLAAFVALRLPLLHLPPFGDEEMFVREASFRNAGNPANYPILGFFLLKSGLFFLGWQKLRWVPFLFSLGVLVLTIALAEDFIGFQGSFYAAWLLALSPLSVSVSPQILMDGSFVAFFFLAFLLAYERGIKAGGLRWQAALGCGILFGCLWLTSYAAFALAFGAGLYSLFHLGFKKTLRDFSIMGLAAAALFSLYPIFFPRHYHQSTDKLGFLHSSPVILHLGAAPWLFISSWAKAVIFIGPLILWGFARAISDGKSRARLALALSCCLGYAALLLIFINPDRTMTYWSAILPLLCLLTANEITQLRALPRWQNLALWTAFYWAVLALLSAAGAHAVFPVHPAHYTRAFWSDYFSVRMFYGPSLGLLIRPAAVVFSFAAVPALGILSRRFSRAQAHLLALGLAYGAFYSLEYSHPLFSPNLNRAAARMTAAFKSHPPAQPLYLHGCSALMCESSGIAAQAFMYNESLISRLIPVMERTGGTLALLDAPAIGPDSELREFLTRHARLTRSFSDDGVVLAEVWNLAPLKRLKR